MSKIQKIVLFLFSALFVALLGFGIYQKYKPTEQSLGTVTSVYPQNFDALNDATLIGQDSWAKELGSSNDNAGLVAAAYASSGKGVKSTYNSATVNLANRVITTQNSGATTFTIKCMLANTSNSDQCRFGSSLGVAATATNIAFYIKIVKESGANNAYLVATDGDTALGTNLGNSFITLTAEVNWAAKTVRAKAGAGDWSGTHTLSNSLASSDRIFYYYSAASNGNYVYLDDVTVTNDDLVTPVTSIPGKERVLIFE